MPANITRKSATAHGSALSSAASLAVSTNWSLSAPQMVNNRFQFTLLGLGNTMYVIDISTNLPNWTPWQTSYPEPIVDALSSNVPARFYRARPGP